MILFNKLVRIDLLVLVTAVMAFVITSDFWHGFLQGFSAALLFISILQHIQHYQRTKKLY
jgi:hypothetical protein